MTQANHIFYNPKNNNKINLHFIGKLENLEEDLKIALNKIGIHNIFHIPSKKNSKQHNNFKNYFDDQSLEKVNILFKEDFFHFDYPMTAL
jgi:predicted metallopeptidase